MHAVKNKKKPTSGNARGIIIIILVFSEVDLTSCHCCAAAGARESLV